MANKAVPRGFGLVETLVTLLVLAILSAIAAPAWSDWIELRRLEGASGELLTDLQYLRSEAVKRRTSMRITFLPSAGGSCYVLHTGSVEDCRCSDAGVASCDAPAEAVKSLFRPARENIRLESNRPSLLYSARLGTVTPTATIRVQAAQGITLRHVVNLMGRVRVCAEDSSQLGHPVCS